VGPTFDRKLTNVAGSLVRGLDCAPTQNLIKKACITINSQSYVNPFSLIFRSLSRSQRHIITSASPYKYSIRIDDEYF